MDLLPQSDFRRMPGSDLIGRRQRLLLTACLLLLGPASVQAAAESSVSSISLIPAGLVTEALDIDQTIRQRQTTAAASAGSTTIYIDSQVPRLLLMEMTLQIDTETPIRYRYGQAEALALQSEAVHRLAKVQVSPGPHKLYAEYVARNPEDKPGTPRIRATLIKEWQQPESAFAMEVSLREATFVGKPQIALSQWIPAANGLDQAELHAIDLMIASGQEMQAASELMELQRRNGSLPGDFQQRLNQSLAALQGGAAGPAAATPVAALPDYQAAASSGDTSALDRLGRQEALDERSLTLRDKANAALGFKLLESGQAKAAAEALRRIRSPGPYSEVALLGLGWSQLVSPNNKPATATATPVKTAFGASATSFSSSHAIAEDKQADDLRRALVPWTELIGRDPTSAPVQEAMLAIPYAMNHLGAHQQAQLYTERAVEKLENTRAHLDDALKHIASGGMYQFTVERDLQAGSGWSWWLASLPEPRWWLSAPPSAPVNFYMERLVQDDDYRRVLQLSRRLYELDQLLARHATTLSDDASAQSLVARISVLRPQLQALSATQRRELEAIATRDIQALKRQSENYLVEAHFAMARMHDRPIGNQGPAR